MLAEYAAPFYCWLLQPCCTQTACKLDNGFRFLPGHALSLSRAADSRATVPACAGASAKHMHDRKVARQAHRKPRVPLFASACFGGGRCSILGTMRCSGSPSSSRRGAGSVACLMLGRASGKGTHSFYIENSCLCVGTVCVCARSAPSPAPAPRACGCAHSLRVVYCRVGDGVEQF